MMFLLLWACQGGGLKSAPGPEIYVEAPKVKSGAAVKLHAPLNVELPTVEGLSFKANGVDSDGKGVWELSGKDGSYIVKIPGPDDKSPPRAQFYVDIGVPGPSAGTLEDLVTPPPPPPPIWPYVLAVLAGLTAIGAGTAWAFKRFQPKPIPPPPEPAWVIARREWDTLRKRTDLEPEALALALSEVYRRYLQVSHGWPATARTTREILDALSGELTAAQLDRARRLLSAMDLVKFADRSRPMADFFEALDADFQELVRPHV